MEQIASNLFQMDNLNEFITFLELHPTDNDEFRLFRGQLNATLKLQ